MGGSDKNVRLRDLVHPDEDEVGGVQPVVIPFTRDEELAALEHEIAEATLPCCYMFRADLENLAKESIEMFRFKQAVDALIKFKARKV